MPSSAPRDRSLRLHVISAGLAVIAGAVSAICVVALILLAIRGYDDGTGWTLMGAIGVSAALALVAAIPGLRHPRLRPVAMEGVELALVGLCTLGVIAFYVYVVFAAYAG